MGWPTSKLCTGAVGIVSLIPGEVSGALPFTCFVCLVPWTRACPRTSGRSLTQSSLFQSQPCQCACGVVNTAQTFLPCLPQPAALLFLVAYLTISTSPSPLPRLFLAGLLQSGLRGVSTLEGSAFDRSIYVVAEGEEANHARIKRLGLPLVPFVEVCTAGDCVHVEARERVQDRAALALRHIQTLERVSLSCAVARTTYTHIRTAQSNTQSSAQLSVHSMRIPEIHTRTHANTLTHSHTHLLTRTHTHTHTHKCSCTTRIPSSTRTCRCNSWTC